MGKSVAILTDVYYPHPMAGGICAHQLAKAFRDEGYIVHVVCYKRKGEAREERFEGLMVHRVKMPLVNSIRDCSERITSDLLSKTMYSIAILANRILKLLFIKWFPLKSPALISHYISCVKKLPIDIVIGEFFSIESALAASLLKTKYGFKYVFYGVDSLSNCDPAKGLSLDYIRKKGLNWERKLFNNADCVAVMKSHKKHYSDNIFKEYKDKMIILDLPLMDIPKDRIKNKDNNNNNNRIRWTYTGSLSHALRSPDCLFRIIEAIHLPIEMHFFSKGDCEMDIHEEQKRIKNVIVQHGHVPKSELEIAYSETEFLISIGNSFGVFLPSKTIEYIAHCKPIIHLCFQENDASLPYLDKYGHALIIRVNEISLEEQVKQIEHFVLDYIVSGKQISSVDTYRLFVENTPEYSVKAIESVLSRSIGNGCK